jgi:hypothetical protein
MKKGELFDFDNQSPCKPYVLLLEGADDVYFFSKYFELSSISNKPQLIKIGGKDRLKDELSSVLKAPNIRSVRAIGFIGDADSSLADELKSVNKALIGLGRSALSDDGFDHSKSPSIGAFFLPDGTTEGDLESLCALMIEHFPSYKIAKTALTSADPTFELKQRSKRLIQAFLALHAKELCAGTGYATLKGAIDIDLDRMRPLNDFLGKLLNL